MGDIRKLKEKQKTFYKSIVSVSCSILNDTVYFTSEGFNHLIYKSNGKPRKISEQFLKLSCLTHAPDVIKKCGQITETRKFKKNVKNKLKDTIHYELVHEVSVGKEMRVIVEKVGTGKHKFLSVMPHRKHKTKKRP